MSRRSLSLFAGVLAFIALLWPKSPPRTSASSFEGSRSRMGMDREAKRTDITIEAVKQQITLASAIIGAIVALANKHDPIWQVLPYALAPFALSVIGGIFALLTIPFALYGEGDPFAAREVRVAGVLQAVLFCVGIVLMVALLAIC